MITWGRILRFIMPISLLLFSNVSTIYAFGVETHRAINKNISKNAVAGFSLDDYLKKELGMQKGYDEKIFGKEVFERIGDGGANEDSGIRSLNHFHNPLTNEGLSGQYSALTWAIGKEYRSSYSWYDVRDYYFQALTASDKANRDYWFAQTFQGVGQVMHLVQDMSIPAHVRRDTHLLGDGYEKWNRKYINDVSQVAGYGVYSYTPYNTSLFLIPQLFDTDQYNGRNPEITISSGGIGLAEYVNANYFSCDTINASNFPYPRIDSNYKAVKLFNGPLGSYNREYFVKNCSGGYCEASASKSYQGYLLSAVDLNDYWRKKMTTSPYFLPVIPGLDENVHADYAQLLIPRAVSHSAEVLKYFFRGKLEVELGDGNIKIKNASNETINPDHGLNSHFYLYYDGADGKRTLLTSALANALAPGDSQTITFSPPVHTTRYMLVYYGQLGNESNAVIGENILLPVFIFTLTRGDGKPVTPDLHPSFRMINSSGDWFYPTKEYIGDKGSPAVPGRWKITFNNQDVVDPNGYWVFYSCDYGIGTHYPYRHNSSSLTKSDLIQPGTYIDTISYFKAESLGWSSSPRWNQTLGAVTLSYRVMSTIPYYICYDFGQSWLAYYTYCNLYGLSGYGTTGTYTVTSGDGAVNFSGTLFLGPRAAKCILQSAGSGVFTLTINAVVNPSTHTYRNPAPPYNELEETDQPVFYQVIDRWDNFSEPPISIYGSYCVQ